MTCPHSDYERDVATHAGACSLCLQAEVMRLRDLTTWQELTTAPAEGEVLLFGADDHGDPAIWAANIGWDGGVKWDGPRLLTPTHWRPMPEAPIAQTTSCATCGHPKEAHWQGKCGVFNINSGLVCQCLKFVERLKPEVPHES